FTDAAEHRLLDRAEAGGSAHAACVVECVDILRIALADDAARCRQAISYEIDLLRPRWCVVEIAPHYIGLAGDHRGQQPGPAAGLELERNADTIEGRTHGVGIETDNAVEIFRIAKRIRRSALRVLGDPDPLADERGIFAGKR